MKKILMFALAGMLLLSACGTTGGDIVVKEPWGRTSMQGGNSAVYFLIDNQSKSDDELIGASSNVAESVEVHQSTMQDGVMQMHMVPSVPLGAGEQVSFEPGGFHVMFINLTQELKAGDMIEVVLHFKSHADITIQAMVKDASGMNMNNMNMGGDSTPQP